jgi:hypothetical protein
VYTHTSPVISGGKRAAASASRQEASHQEAATVTATKDQKDQQAATREYATRRGSSITLSYGRQDVQTDGAGEAHGLARAAFEAPSWWRGGGDRSAGTPGAGGKEESAHGLAQLQQQRQQWAALAGVQQRSS